MGRKEVNEDNDTPTPILKKRATVKVSRGPLRVYGRDQTKKLGKRNKTITHST